MTSSGPSAYGADLLTRTILQIDGVMSITSIAQVTRALQRVPGVLLAEVNAASARATVAHDDAVTTASLLAAAAGAGVRAEIVAGPPAAAPTGGAALEPRLNWNRYLRILTVAGFAAFAVTGMLVPGVADKHWLLPAVISSLWLVFLAKSIAGRPRS
jgi:Cu+-exporting ATPase